MEIRISTNIDAYKFKFKREFNFVPRIGEKVEVDEVCQEGIIKLRLPTCLTVVDVVYKEKHVSVELHYSESDISRAKICDINLFP